MLRLTWCGIQHRRRCPYLILCPVDLIEGFNSFTPHVDEIVVVFDSGAGVAPRDQPHLWVRVQREERRHPLLVVYEEVGDSLGLRLRECPGSWVRLLTRVVAGSLLTPVEVPVAIQVYSFTVLSITPKQSNTKQNIINITVLCSHTHNTKVPWTTNRLQ